LHDRGKVLVQVALMLAGGAVSCADVEQPRLGEDLFGWLLPDTTVFRAFHELTPATRWAIAKAVTPDSAGCTDGFCRPATE
jgi:hypothetical protein